MAQPKSCKVTFMPDGKEIAVSAGTTVAEAARLAGVAVNLPCGGQGRCGRCLVLVQAGAVERRPSAKLTPELEQQGYALACLTYLQGDANIFVPEQEAIAQTLMPDRKAPEKVAKAEAFLVNPEPFITSCLLNLEPPSLDDNTADLDRLRRHLSRECGISSTETSLPLARRLGGILRENDWRVQTVLEQTNGDKRFILDVHNAAQPAKLYGVAIDIGTTSNVVHLVDLETGRILDTALAYNGQIACGEDVISRIIFSKREGGLAQLQSLVLQTINGLIEELTEKHHVKAVEIVRATVAANTVMTQLFLAIDPQPIRLSPYIPTMTHVIPVRAHEIGLNIHPEAMVDCLPMIGAYVGSDIVAGALASGMADSEEMSLFIDIGTNGEMVFGNKDFLVCCACSAGPAFEGSGVSHGMRAAAGAIDAVWLDAQYEPTWRVIGRTKPRGICGSGMISLLAELFIAGVVTKGGRMQRNLGTPRIRDGAHGAEYVIVWGEQSADGEDIVITEVDIDNLLRTKAAIYGGVTVLLQSVGAQIEDLSQVLIGGVFGQFLDVERAVQIGLLPDIPWERFHFLGNTSVAGAYQCLVNRERRQRVEEIGSMMTYLELSADNRFMDAFTAALFLPHTEADRLFPSVQAQIEGRSV